MKVHTLTIHDYADRGGHTSLHTTRMGAFQDLVEWVRGVWDPEIMDRGMDSFESNGDMVGHFFDFMEDDYGYNMAEKDILGPEVAEEGPLGPDEITLYPLEVEATIYALENVLYAEMSPALNHGPDTCHKVAQDIIKKLKA